MLFLCNNIKTITRLGANRLTSHEKYGIINSLINKSLTNECDNMKKVLLSHDGKMKMYLVPDEVADNLKEYCMHFGFDWLMNDPNAQKLRVITPSGIIGYIFGAQDFIDYLNDFIFPNQKSILVGEMNFYDYEIPEEYKDIPWFNF